MREYILERTQIIPQSREAVFGFFSDPSNLELITPLVAFQNPYEPFTPRGSFHL